MICKNVKVGISDDVIPLVDFGNGTTGMSSFFREDFSQGCLALDTVEEREVGSVEECSSPSAPEMLWVFYTVEAIDVVMKQLAQIKQSMAKKEMVEFEDMDNQV